MGGQLISSLKALKTLIKHPGHLSPGPCDGNKLGGPGAAKPEEPCSTLIQLCC